MICGLYDHYETPHGWQIQYPSRYFTFETLLSLYNIPLSTEEQAALVQAALQYLPVALIPLTQKGCRIPEEDQKKLDSDLLKAVLAIS